MRKGRKGRQKERRGRGRAKEMKMKDEEEEEEEECMGAAEGEGEGRTRFFGCYLLTSLNPRYKGSTYIGFTVNPKRRIRQHNGEITSGASSTKKKRPWEMVLCIHGFPSHVSALQFEWAWQHPRDSIAVRETAASFKTLGGLPNKIKLALTMLTLPSWHSMDLSVSFFSTNYMKHVAGSPSLPPHMNLHFSSLDDLPCYSDPHCPYVSNHDGDDDIDEVHFTSLDRTPEFDFVQEHPSNDAHSDTLPYTPQHPSNDTLQYTSEYTCNQHAAGGTLDEDAPYMMSNAKPEEQLPSHQLPPNVCGSAVELLRPSLGDNVTPFPSYNFSNNMLPMLKKHVYLCTPSPTRNELNDDSRPSEEEPFRRAAPFVRDQPSTFDYVSVTNKDVGDEDLTCIFISETPEEKRHPVGKARPNSHVDIVGPSSTKAIDPVEVIDLYTPSPDCRIAAVSKKRRISSDCSNFVDLTNSPLFLEL